MSDRGFGIEACLIANLLGVNQANRHACTRVFVNLVRHIYQMIDAGYGIIVIERISSLIVDHHHINRARACGSGRQIIRLKGIVFIKRQVETASPHQHGD